MTLFKWLLAVLVAYGGLVAFMYATQRSMMYFPESHRTAPSAAGFPQAEEIVIETSDGERLIAWHVAPQDGRPIVLYFHGNGASLRWRVSRFAALIADGTGLLALSYRGYGGSTGHPTEDGLIEDARAAYGFVAGKYTAERIVLWGESLGSAVAVSLAAESPVARMVLQAAFTSAADVGAAAYPFVPVRYLMKDQFRSDLRISKVTAPVLMVHGANDRVVPISYGERLYAMITAPKRFVRLDGADHNDQDNFGAMDVIRAFIAGKSSVAGGGP